jgi:hypothetical protein
MLLGPWPFCRYCKHMFGESTNDIREYCCTIHSLWFVDASLCACGACTNRVCMCCNCRLSESKSYVCTRVYNHALIPVYIHVCSIFFIFVRWISRVMLVYMLYILLGCRSRGECVNVSNLSSILAHECTCKHATCQISVFL